jgi:DNA-directed RNA polymerase specialized sigma24 family protein
MNQHESKPPATGGDVQPTKVLETYYGQLLKWGAILTRSDLGMAQDIVHDLCLHFTLTRPDLSGITNLDNYLYTCLRHVYLSTINRSSREALSLVSTAEFDSVKLALIPSRSGDLLQKQNDLRRICCYSVWRKEYTKSASYFILRFFHGYHYQEIAELGHHSLPAIYNHLKMARSEVKLHLQEPGKLQFANRVLPPTPVLVWSPLSSIAMFKELRQTILRARTGNCLPEERLLSHYRAESSRSISCSLLSHVVSCERCLDLIDQYFGRPTLESREPLDSTENCNDVGAPQELKMSLDRMLRSVRRDWGETRDHRPRTLSIAVDGKILASHEVQAQRNTLSARISRPDQISFVEVFSEQGLRLALMPIGAMPPDGPHERTLRVTLNDDRWLDLKLSFDGLGLNTEVTYLDPALAVDTSEEDELDMLVPLRPEPPLKSVLPWSQRRLFALTARMLRGWIPSPVCGWALALACIFTTAGYFAYRYESRQPSLDASVMLKRSVEAELASLKNQTEHQVLWMEVADTGGAVRQHGMIDLWKDGSGARSMRRLYDAQHRLIAAEWRQQNVRQGQYLRSNGKRSSGADEEFLRENLWKRDTSSSAFSESAKQNVRIRSLADGYELSTSGPTSEHPQLISAKLVLDRQLHPIRETMQLHTVAGIRVVRFLQADYELRSSSSVPDAIFEPQHEGIQSSAGRRSIAPVNAATDTQLSELLIAVLYRLSNLAANPSEQIEATRTQNGYVQVLGIVADDARKKTLVLNLNGLKDRQLLKIQLVTPRDIQTHSVPVRQTTYEPANVYEMRETRAPVDAALRRHFQAEGLSGEAVDVAVAAFSREVLEHAQRALEQASALERLGSNFSEAELTSVSLLSQQQWVEMVGKYAATLQVELRALQGQLAQLAPANEPQPRAGIALNITVDSPAQFMGVAAQLLRDTQATNQQISNTFAIHGAENTKSDPDSLLASVRSAIPVKEAAEVASFAVKLNASARAAQMNQPNTGVAKSLP